MKKFFSGKRVTTILQHEASECGLAATAMVMRYHGHKIDLAFMRALRPVSRVGLTFADIVDVCDRMGFDARGFALGSIEDLGKVSLPAILHWSGNHFVVLEKITAQGYVVHDPAFGRRVYAASDMSRFFAGIVLEIEPRIDFVKIKSERRSALVSVLKSCRGLESSVLQIAIVSMVVSLLALATPILLQFSLDVVLPQYDLDLMTIVAVGLALFLVFDAVGLWLRDMIILRTSIQFQLHFTRNILGHAFRLPFSFFQSRHPGDIVARLDSVDAIKTYMVSGLVSTIADSLMSVLTVALMLYYSPAMTAMVLATLLILVVLRIAYFPAVRDYSNAALEAHSEERSHLLDGLRHAEALKAHNAAEQHTSKWFDSFVRFANADFKSKRVERSADLVLRIVVALGTVGTLYYGVASVMQSTMSVGMLYAFFALRGAFFEKVDMLTRQLMTLSILSAHFSRINDIIDQKPEQEAGVGAIDRQIRRRVRLENVAVQFSRDDEPIVAGVNLDIDIAGRESIAIVGPSGSGKSSLLRILASIAAPHQGQLLVDDQPVHRFGLQEFRSGLGVVFADDGLFAGTLAENLSLFRAEVTREKMEQALAAVGLLEDVRRLPQGFATLLSDKSGLLSTGQRRRLLAARAICRAPRLFLLDEVTANLDAVSEAALMEGLLAQPGGKVFVTHSPSLLKRVDSVYAIENGRFVKRERAEVTPLENLERPLQTAVAG